MTAPPKPTIAEMIAQARHPDWRKATGDVWNLAELLADAAESLAREVEEAREALRVSRLECQSLEMVDRCNAEHQETIASLRAQLASAEKDRQMLLDLQQVTANNVTRARELALREAAEVCEREARRVWESYMPTGRTSEGNEVQAVGQRILALLTPPHDEGTKP